RSRRLFCFSRRPFADGSHGSDRSITEGLSVLVIDKSSSAALTVGVMMASSYSAKDEDGHISVSGPGGGSLRGKKPENTAFKQQRLPAWQPILTAGTVLPAFFIIGLLFIPVGIGLYVTSNNIKELEVDYTGVDMSSPCFNCSQSFSWNSSRPCTCTIPFYLEQPYESNVYVYYGLSNFYQNHRRYVKSRDDSQLNGDMESLMKRVAVLKHIEQFHSPPPQKPSKECEPYAIHDKPIAPCGAIANSMFNDTLELFYHDPNGTKVQIPLSSTGIAWWTDKHVKFRNPQPSNPNLTAVFQGTTKPVNWRRPVYELDTDPENNGFINEDFIVWMRTAALPTFRKLYRIINKKDSMVPTLPRGNYSLEVVYNYPVRSFEGRKRMILSTISWMGGKNPFLGIAYITVGSVCFFLGVAIQQVARRGISSSARRQVNRVPEKQKLFQEDNGVPVHLKGGSADALLYRTTMALTVLDLKDVLFEVFKQNQGVNLKVVMSFYFLYFLYEFSCLCGGDKLELLHSCAGEPEELKMKSRLFLAAAALLALLLSSCQAQSQVDSPSDLRFKILNENTVQMMWSKPRSRIQGYRIQVTSDTEEPIKEFSLPASSTKTSISDLTPDVDYVVTISAYAGSEESLPISGQITLESSGGTRGTSRKPDTSDSVKCSGSAIADLVFLVDGSWSVGRANFKFIRNFISATAGAFQIGEERTRVAVVQYSSDARTEFNLNMHLTRPALLRAIGSLPYKGGDTMTGDALNYLLKNTFTEDAGARKSFPKVLVIITDGKSEDPVESYARQLRSRGVEIFVLGVQQADEEEMKLMASPPFGSHIFSAANFNEIKNVQKQLITQVCAGVEDQLGSFVSGEEVVEPASNLQVLEVASKSIRMTWDASIGEISGYKVQMIPMMTGSKRQELYVSPGQTSVVVRNLSPDTEYQIRLYALKGLSPSEPVMVMQKTQPVTVSVECSLGVDVQADVVLLVDGSYSIGLANFAKVRAFLEVLVNSFDIGADKVQISLVQYSRDPHTEFYLNTHHDLNAVVKAVRSFPYRGGSTNTGRAMKYVREKIFQASRGARPNVPRVTILITDGKSSDAFQDPATKLRNSDVEIFAVGVKDAVRSELEAIANTPAETHVYTVEDFDAFQRISKELTQSICLRIEQELRKINQRQLIRPRDLTFSEVGSRSFRATWAIDATNVDSYLVQFKPVDELNGHNVSMSLPGNTLTAVLPNLTPLTRYEVNIIAQYDDLDSLPVTGYETTLEELGSVQNLRVSEETTESFRVSWQPAPGGVTRYRLTYHPVGDDSSRLETATVGAETTIVLQELQPQTTYRVTVTPEYESGPGVPQQTDGTTKEARGSPRDLRVFDETVTSMKVSWQLAPGNVLQYRVAYRPSAGGAQKEISVKGDNTAALLKNLQPATEYDIFVSARYPSGLGDALEGQGTTLEDVGPPKNLVTSDVTDSSFAVSWTAAPGNVKMYRVQWKSLFSEEDGEKTVPGDETNTVLDGLSPETLYQVSVVAAYDHKDSEPLTGQETTDASAEGKKLTVSEETERTMRVTWLPAPGKVLNYRLRYVPSLGGKEVALKIPGTVTSTVMKRLQPITTYNITVHPIYKRGEGKARQGVGTTQPIYKAPRNLQTSEPTKNSFRVSWDPAPGEVKGYKVTFHPSGDDVDLGELLVGPYDNTVVLEELRAGTKYAVAVFGMFDGGESLPLAGEEKTTLMDDPDLPAPDTSETQCKTSAKADIVLLVDGSWSIGRINFKTIRNFIARMVSVFDIGPDRVQIGLAQYSGDPKTEWHLNAHPTRDSLLEAIANLPYKGGNTMTGMALNYILQNNFRPNVGLRADSRKIGVLITDGKSQDEIVFNSQNLRDSGIELYAIGVKNADENELRSIASDPDEIHMYNVNDFQFLLDIVDDLTINLCNSVKGPGGELEAPTNLVTSEVTHHSFRATWTAPGTPVDNYRVTYVMAAGGPTQELQIEIRNYLIKEINKIMTTHLMPGYFYFGSKELVVDGSETTVVLKSLSALTEYIVNVYAMAGEESSEPLTGTETTLPLSAVTSMNVYDETSNTMRVRWGAADGATGYMLLYKSINATEPQLEKEVRVGGGVTDVQLVELIPNTAYSISLYALHGEGVSNPLEGTGVT
ncbi:hypothetical protein L3Q82_011406, partial [Scortum barcoo]